MPQAGWQQPTCPLLGDLALASLYLGADLLLLLAMGTVSSAMLGEDAFKAFIERFIEKVG